MIRVTNKRHGASGEYIGRPSPLGNPFVIGRDGNRAEVIQKYHAWITDKWENGEFDDPVVQELIRLTHVWLKEPHELTLVCWCAPQACHGDVIKELIEKHVGPEVAMFYISEGVS